MPFDVGQSPTPPSNPMLPAPGAAQTPAQPNPMMAQQPQQQQAPQQPQITPAQAADMRLHMQVTGAAIQQLQANPDATPKDAIKLIGSIIANNPDHFDANWGAGILSGLPSDPVAFRAKIAQLAQQQQYMHAALNQMHPQPKPEIVAASARTNALGGLLNRGNLTPQDVAPHVGMAPKDLPEDHNELRHVVAGHFMQVVGHEHALRMPKAIGAAN